MTHWKIIGPILVIDLVLVGALVFCITKITKLSAEVATQKETLTTTQKELAQAQQEKTDLLTALQEAADKSTTFATQLSKVTESYDKLRWLSTLDPQLLQKYSKVYFLNENYAPKEISPIDTKYLSAQKTGKTIEIHDRVLPFLQKMLQQAATDGVTIQVQSAYRSFAEQTSLKANYKVRYGSGANAFSADQGYSEHQLATTLDLTTPKMGSSLVESFDKTPEFAWLKENAHKYGFILSYPANNSYYVYEPWHWRFVGIELATKLKNENKNFYDLDQREINTFLGNMFNP
jgi:D-alanyl-D-alanine carboxypeptidase